LSSFLKLLLTEIETPIKKTAPGAAPDAVVESIGSPTRKSDWQQALMPHDTQKILFLFDVDCHNCMAPLNESLDKPSRLRAKRLSKLKCGRNSGISDQK